MGFTSPSDSCLNMLQRSVSALGSARGVPVPNPELLCRSKTTLMVNGSRIQPQGFSPSTNAAAPRAVAVFQDSVWNREKGSLAVELQRDYKTGGDLHASHQK